MKKILIITHFNFSSHGPIHGPAHSICDYLKKETPPYLLIAHPLYPGAKTYREEFNGKKVLRRDVGEKGSEPFLLKTIKEVTKTLSLAGGETFDLAIGADPHSALTALLLKFLGRVKKVIYYSVDYADVRFENPILNYLYQLTDRMVMRFSDRVWSVSTRISQKRASFGLPQEKNFFVPNSPVFDEKRILPATKVKIFDVVFVTGATHAPVFEMVISAFLSAAKRYPKARLKVIGVTQVKAGSKNVDFLGHLEHQKMLSEIAKCGVGLAIYTDDFPWTRYGDSMKARDYLSVGVPVIITDVVSTADDIKKAGAGIVIQSEKRQLTSAIQKFFHDQDFWLESRENALKMAKKFDFAKIVGPALKF